MYIPVGDRDSKGRFVAGNIGNPKGRPKRELTVDEILEAALPEAVTRLIDLVHSEDESIALQAASIIIDRTLGKAEETRKFKANISLDNMYDLGRALAYSRLYPDKD